jgi:hypothetical protein
VYGASVTYAFAIVAGGLTAAVLAAWPWARSRRRFAVAGVATLLSWIAWHLLLNATGAFGFDVDAPLIRVSWEDVGSGVVALFTTVVVFGLGTERREAAVRVVGVGSGACGGPSSTSAATATTCSSGKISEKWASTGVRSHPSSACPMR